MSIQYYVDKTSGTSADTLLAMGFASLLGDLALIQHGTQRGILLCDSGPCFTVRLERPLQIESLSDDELTGLQVVLPLDSGRQREKLAKKGDGQQKLDGFDYDARLEERRIYREQVKKLGPELQTPEARLRKAPELQALNEPDTRIDHYVAINMMKIAGTFNELAMRWDRLTPVEKRLHLDLLLRLFGDPCNDIAQAINEWQKLAKELAIKGNAMVSALQIINPTTGKGANRAKANELTIGNQESFWLLELLKFRGFMVGAAPLVVQDSDDRKTYVIQPRQIKLTDLQEMMKDFRAVFWATTAVKLDIFAALRLAQVLVEHYKTLYEQQQQEEEDYMPRDPVSLAPGFDVTFYKFLGSAHATMNIATIGLPTWLPELDSLERVEAAAALLQEHVDLIRNIRNAKGGEDAEEYELLRFYRDFLSGDDLSAFWDFTTAYSSYVMSEKNRYARLLTTKGLEILLMNERNNGATLKTIVENQGFRHIANAIRQATITAQYRNSQHSDRTYDIRYGLGQELKRKAHRPQEFMEALGSFLQRYSEETAREEEKLANRLHAGQPLTNEERRANGLRVNIEERDLDEVVGLIDQYGSSLICSMLIAYGYARFSKDEETVNAKNA